MIEEKMKEETKKYIRNDRREMTEGEKQRNA